MPRYSLSSSYSNGTPIMCILKIFSGCEGLQLPPRESDKSFYQFIWGPVALCICVCLHGIVSANFSSESPANYFINSYGRAGPTLYLCMPTRDSECQLQLRESSKSFYQFIWGTGPTLYLCMPTRDSECQLQLRESSKSFYQFIWGTGPTLHLYGIAVKLSLSL